jgi:hypothetical protein
MVVIFAIAGVAAYKANRNATAPPTEPPAPPFPALLLLPILVAYFLLGEYFSFGMAFKSMRFILIIVPVFWLAVFWALERWRMRPGLIFVAAAAYTLCALGQILFNSFESGEVEAESYQLQGDWLSRLPPWHSGSPGAIATTRNILDFIHNALPEGSKVAVGTEQLFLTSESLTWASDYGPALRGQPSPYLFANFLTSDGQISRPSLLDARGILVFVHPSVQYSHAVQAASVRIVQAAGDQSANLGVAQIAAIQGSDGNIPLGYLVILKAPLGDFQVTDLIAASHCDELSPGVEFGRATESRITWAQAGDLIRRWEQQRIGGSAR